MRTLVVFFLGVRALVAAYSNLIPTADGNAVYFQVATGPATNTWYAARAGKTGLAIEPLAQSLADVNGDGNVLAWSTSYPRSCSFAGSSCWLADWCQAAFGIEGPGFHTGNSRYQTLVRLDAAGTLAWIDQKSCQSIGPATSPLSGLYDTRHASPGRAIRQSRARESALRTPRHHRARQALTLAGPQLQWLDASGAHPIRNVYGADEAVTDAAGANVVYLEGFGGELHWVTGPDWLGALDEDLHLQGSAPALTPDGAALLFLAPDGSLQLYTRATRSVRTLAPGSYLSFAVTADAAFAVTAAGALVRIDLATGASATWLAPFPGIQSVDAANRRNFTMPCPYICYAPEDYGIFVDPGMILALHGDSLGQPGWRARIGGLETPLVSQGDSAAWFQAPSGLPVTGQLQPVEIYHPDHPIRYTMMIEIATGIPACLATVHQDFTRPVDASAPAMPGEVVHVFLTGLQGTEPVPDGVPNPTDRLIPVANPPPFADPAALQPLFFGLAPGLIGIQQLDLLVLGTTADIFAEPRAFHCAGPE